MSSAAVDAPVAAAIVRRCRVCGCTDDCACIVDGVPCAWADTSRERGNVCSACDAVLNHPTMRMHTSLPSLSGLRPSSPLDGGTWLATCGCGWTFAGSHGARETAVASHWMAVAGRTTP